MNAIIYTTNTGSTEHYARLLAHETGLPAYSLAEAKKKVYPRTEVVYMGWIMASSVKGYAEAAKRYHVCAVCAVGMGQTGTIFWFKPSILPFAMWNFPCATIPSKCVCICIVESREGRRD